jgi:hypothetical protein
MYKSHRNNLMIANVIKPADIPAPRSQSVLCAFSFFGNLGWQLTPDRRGVMQRTVTVDAVIKAVNEPVIGHGYRGKIPLALDP